MSPWREPWLKEYKTDGEGAAPVGVTAAQSPGLPGLCRPRRWASTILGGKATWQGGEALAPLEASPLSSLGPDSEKWILGAPFSFLLKSNACWISFVTSMEITELT